MRRRADSDVPVAVEDINTALAVRLVHLTFGPHDGTQALYYLAYGDGTVHRVVFNQTR